MTRPKEPVPRVLVLSKSSKEAVFFEGLFHFLSKSAFACSRYALTVGLKPDSGRETREQHRS
jgi:hypothetical protein